MLACKISNYINKNASVQFSYFRLRLENIYKWVPKYILSVKVKMANIWATLFRNLGETRIWFDVNKTDKTSQNYLADTL